MFIENHVKVLCVAWLLGICGFAVGQVTEQQAERIKAAAPAKATVKPKQARRVLIWNTPFMDQSPHKGYTIPQAEYAMKLLGQNTGAFEPIVSDDVAMYLPENLAKFERVEKYHKENVPNNPQIVYDTLEATKKRLNEARAKYGDYISPFVLSD